MLEESFTFESDHFTHDDLSDRIKITIQIKCSDRFLEKYAWKFLYIENLDEPDESKSNLIIDNFSFEEQKKIKIIAENLATKNLSQAFSNHLAYMSDRFCDQERENEI